MKQSTLQILKLFFNDGEEICVSHNKYGYHSVSQKDLIGDIVLKSPNANFGPTVIKECDINMLTINPISGFRCDESVTAFRSFLVELDDDTLAEQKIYVQTMQMPYSACIFSGNKSLHYGIVLNEDLPDYDTWKTYAEWILNIMTKADQATKNPSRNIRFPGNKRNDGKKMEQTLINISKRIDLADLNIWLHRYPECKPKPPKPVASFTSVSSLLDIPKWVIHELNEGIDHQRNNTWFRMAISMAKKGFIEDQIVEVFEPYFMEQRDFKRSEWLTTIRSGIKRAYEEKT